MVYLVILTVFAIIVQTDKSTVLCCAVQNDYLIQNLLNTSTKEVQPLKGRLQLCCACIKASQICGVEQKPKIIMPWSIVTIIAVLDRKICSTCRALFFVLQRVAIMKHISKKSNGPSSSRTHIAAKKHNYRNYYVSCDENIKI